ncbi:cell wall hydrolase [Albidovulum sp.]
MSVLKCWSRGLLLALALAGGARAEMTVSQSNDPSAALGVNLADLLDQERATLGQMSSSRLSALMAPPPARTRGKAAPITYDAAWLASLPEPKGGEQMECLATALYFEARGESIKGQVAVAEVILNRVDSARFPTTVCAVVNQSNSRGCQFSFNCDGLPERIGNKAAWLTARKIAQAMLDGAPRALTGGATYFHTPAVRASWSRRFERTAQIGGHIFYRAPVQTAQN